MTDEHFELCLKQTLPAIAASRAICRQFLNELGSKLREQMLQYEAEEVPTKRVVRRLEKLLC
jgi:hypothetical protein